MLHHAQNKIPEDVKLLLPVLRQGSADVTPPDRVHGRPRVPAVTHRARTRPNGSVSPDRGAVKTSPSYGEMMEAFELTQNNNNNVYLADSVSCWATVTVSNIRTHMEADSRGGCVVQAASLQ